MSSCQHSYVFLYAGDVLNELLQQLKRIPFPIDLGSLARVEQNVAEHFKAPTFYSLGNDSFLHFLASNERALKALGGHFLGSYSSNFDAKEKVLNLLSQLETDKRNDKVNGKFLLS